MSNDEQQHQLAQSSASTQGDNDGHQVGVNDGEMHQHYHYQHQLTHALTADGGKTKPVRKIPNWLRDQFPEGQGVVDLAACHTCLFVPETSCERGNRFLDRSLLVPTVEPGRQTLAFFQDE